MPSASTALRATETFDIAEVQPSPRDLKIMARRLAVHCAVYRGAIPTIAFWQLGSTLALFTVVIGLMFLTVQNYIPSYRYRHQIYLRFLGVRQLNEYHDKFCTHT